MAEKCCERVKDDELRFIVCETVAAITLHLRVMLPGEVPCYSGRARGNAKTLCRKPVGWDTKIPIDQARCTSCLEVKKEVEQKYEEWREERFQKWINDPLRCSAHTDWSLYQPAQKKVR